MRQHAMVRRLSAILAMLSLFGAILVGQSTAAPSAEAAVANQFNLGYIISDAVFYNSGTMTADQIQGFMNSKVPSCAGGYVCLKSYTESTYTRSADSQCQTYQGAGNESAAQIIFKVGQACHINPQVLLVMLQKEQALVTNTAPSDTRFRIAMGYGCPDTAPCDSEFYGFYNQVYKAAWQYQRYARNPTSYNYRAGVSNYIQYHPNAGCGGSQVNIQNQATASLYIYTPYQPNAGALANLGGTGDGCSSYGNRNFWVYFSDWFGSPTDSHVPFGEFESAQVVKGGVQIKGWGLDPDSTTPLQMHVYVDGVFNSVITADTYRADVAALSSDYGDHRGFSLLLPLSFASHTICLWGLNQGPGAVSQIGTCRTAAIDGSPIGELEMAMGTASGIALKGWVVDPDTSAPINFHVYVDGAFVVQVAADSSRPDVAAAFPGMGAAHGFDTTVPVSRGTHSVCLWAVNVLGGSIVQIGKCTTVTVDGSPFGRIESITKSPGGARIDGWIIDPDTTAPVEVRVYVDGVETASAFANSSRPDVGAKYPGAGANRGLSTTVTMAPGTREICVWAINAAGGGGVSRIGDCNVVTVGGSPLGAVDPVVIVPGGVKISGWLVDPDTSSSLNAHVYVDGVFASAIVASRPRTLASPYDVYGPNHGFEYTLMGASEGVHSVCIWGLNVGVGEIVRIGDCLTVTVNSSPQGAFESLTNVAGGVQLSGWLLDPDTADPIGLHVYVNGKFATQVTASGPRPDIGTANPGFGDNHGFSATVPTGEGPNTVCLWALNVGRGSITKVGQCKTVQVVGSSPFGAFEALQPTIGGLRVQGWVIDPDVAGGTDLHVYVDGQRVRILTATVDRPDIVAANPGFGSAHGFDSTIPVPGGTHQVCLWAPNVGPGEVKQIGACQTVTVGGSPVGAFDPIQPSARGASIKGWVLDPDQLAASDVHVYVDNVFAQAVTASTSRSDISAAYAAFGANHGFDLLVPMSPGVHRVCLWAPNVGAGEVKQIGTCQSVNVGSPFGAFESLRPGSGSVQVVGWLIDPDTVSPVQVHVYIDGAFATALTADVDRPDVASSIPGFGSQHGFSALVPTSSGTHTVCLWAPNIGFGEVRQIGSCQTATVG